MSSKDYFDTVASDWDRIRQSLFSTELRNQALSAVPLPEEALAADLGAGTGFLTRGLLGRGLRVIAVDQSEAMLSELRRKTGPSERLETRVGDAEILPLEDGSVDLVFANMFLHHVEKPGVAIREMARILVPGGSLVLTDLDAHEHEFLRTEQHDRWLGFHREDLKGWLRDAGLEEIEVRDAGESCCSTSSCGEEAEIDVFLATGRRPRSSDSGSNDRNAETTRSHVRARYAEAARQANAGESSGCGCGCSAPSKPGRGRELYRSMEHEMPTEITTSSLGCANPVTLAELRPGEDVLDLGSGGGLDVLLSARRVAPGGTAYGLDMTEEMLELARRHQAEAGIENAEFLRGTLEEIPLPDGSVDVVLSNCVINLSPDKSRALSEAYRVLRPGGRLAVADMVATGKLPSRLRRRPELWTACVAGAVETEEYRRLLRSRGFRGVEIEVVRSFSAEDLGAAGRNLLEEEGIDSASVDGLLASALIRAEKPVDDDERSGGVGIELPR